MTLRVVSAATVWPVTLAQAKAHLGVWHSDFDARITALIKTATAAVEAATQRVFLRQTLEWSLPCWTARVIRLPIAADTIENLEIAYVALGQDEAVTLDPSEFVVSRSGHTLCVRPIASTTWPVLEPDAVDRVLITFDAGEPGAEAAAPSEVATAVLFMVEYLFDPNAPQWKFAASGLPETVELLVQSLRWD